MNREGKASRFSAKRAAPCMILLAGILWGTLGVPTRVLDAQGLSAMQCVIFRAWGASVILIPALFLYDRRLLRIRLKDIWCFLGTGVCSIVFFNTCYFMAMTMTSLSVAAVLLYTAPIFVVLLSRLLFGESLTGKKLLAMALAFVGCVFVTGIAGGGAALSGRGLLVGLGAGFGYALYSIFGRLALNRGYTSMTVTAYTFLTASIVMLPFSRPGQIWKAVSAGRQAGMAAAYLVLAGTAAAYLLYTVGLVYVEASKASIMASIEPVVATLTGMILYGERPTAAGAIGIVLVLTAVVLLNLPDRQAGK